MLGHLKLCKYRGFESYELADLARVNLLVGKNNCGKTSILEAVHFLVSKGDPSVLVQAAQRRGEISRKGEGPNISHFFLGIALSLVRVSDFRKAIMDQTPRRRVMVWFPPNLSLPMSRINRISNFRLRSSQARRVNPSPLVFKSRAPLARNFLFCRSPKTGRCRRWINCAFYGLSMSRNCPPLCSSPRIRSISIPCDLYGTAF